MENQTSENVLLVPYDFTEVADCAVDHALGMAKMLKYEVRLFHVTSKDDLAATQAEKADKLKAISDNLAIEHNVPVKFLIKEGSIFKDIANAALYTGSKFVVMGTHGKKGLQHIAGSYAMKVITKSTVPFIVVQKKPFSYDGYKNIVITIDDTTESKQKIKWAVYIAQIFNSTIHVYSPNENDTDINAKIKRNLSQIKSVFEKNSITFTEAKPNEVGGNFAKHVIAYSQEVNADLIVIMTNPDQLLPNFVLGKWVEQILFNAAQIPVMCINPKDFHIMIIGL